MVWVLALISASTPFIIGLSSSFAQCLTRSLALLLFSIVTSTEPANSFSIFSSYTNTCSPLILARDFQSLRSPNTWPDGNEQENVSTITLWISSSMLASRIAMKKFFEKSPFTFKMSVSDINPPYCLINTLSPSLASIVLLNTVFAISDIT